MRELILRRNHAAINSAVLGLSKHHTAFHFNQVRFKSSARALDASIPEKAAAPPAETVDGQSDPIAASAPAVVTDRKYAILGLVPDLSKTRPAPLNIPEAPHPYAWPSKKSVDPSKWDFKYLFSLGKAYGRFYMTGLKGVWGNWRLMRQIQTGLVGVDPNDAARYASTSQRISYNEYELLLRAKRDLKKLIPFGLVFAICGEFTPLVIVLLGSSVVPGTCVIPKQVVGDRQKMLEKDRLSTQKAAEALEVFDADTKTMQKTDITSVDYMMYLDAYRSGLATYIIGPAAFKSAFNQLYWRYRILPRLVRHYNEILSTASLVRREGGWEKRSPQDMWEWGNKVGLYQLRQWSRKAIEKGDDPVSEKMKSEMLPYFQKETQEILSYPWHTVPRREHWRSVANRSYDKSPDQEKRADDAGMQAERSKARKSK